MSDLVVRSNDARWMVEVSLTNPGPDPRAGRLGGFTLEGVGNSFDHGSRWDLPEAPQPVAAGATTTQSFDLKAKLGERVPGPGEYTLTVMVLVGDEYMPSPAAKVTITSK
ncbi:hypothetical protein [Haliangium sp.]|uniref:hypothetical protein n=1 Tax=Haliangium sp. TaxID=2663208 RepID=UPI003D13C7C5